jgi:hypothetical protein
MVRNLSPVPHVPQEKGRAIWWKRASEVAKAWEISLLAWPHASCPFNVSTQAGSADGMPFQAVCQLAASYFSMRNACFLKQRYSTWLTSDFFDLPPLPLRLAPAQRPRLFTYQRILLRLSCKDSHGRRAQGSGLRVQVSGLRTQETRSSFRDWR